MQEAEIIEDITIALRRVIRAIDQHSRLLVRDYGITGPQALLLKEIVIAKKITGSELSRRASLSQATVTDIINRLERRGLVQRQRDDLDKRKIMIIASKEGKELIMQSVPLLQEKFQARLRNLQEWEKLQLLSSLQRIAEMMDAKDLDAAAMLTSGALETPPEAIDTEVKAD